MNALEPNDWGEATPDDARESLLLQYNRQREQLQAELAKLDRIIELLSTTPSASEIMLLTSQVAKE